MFRLSVALLSILLPLVIYAQVVQVEFVDTPEAASEYAEAHSVAASLVHYLWKRQYETHCGADLLILEYSDEYFFVCVFDNVHDGSSYLFIEIGGESYADTKEVLVLHDGAVIRHNARWGSKANDALSVLIPNLQANPGEYIVVGSVQRSGTLARRTAQFTIEPMGALEE